MAAITWSSSLAASPYVTLTVTQTAQSVVNNLSTVSYSLVIHRPSVIYSSASKAWTITINGVKVSGTTTIGGSGNKTIKTGTMNVAHNSDGSKSLSIAFTCVLDITWSGTHIGTASKSGTMALTTIPRASSFAVGTGTLGNSQIVTISRASSSFTHTITYTCGTASGRLVTKTTDTSVTWTPPISLASQNTAGTKVTLTMTLYTYSGSTNIGTSTRTVTYVIPASVKPTVSAVLSDENNYETFFHGYVKGKSKVKAVITAGTSYGSEIVSYQLTSNDIGTFKSSSNTITTGILQTSGTISIDIIVTDKRGRTASVTKTITSHLYSEPTIPTFTVHRCLSDGTIDPKGGYCKLDYAFNVTQIGSYNPSYYKYKYKKTSETDYTTVTIPITTYGTPQYTQSGSVIFACDGNYAYNIGVSAQDYFTTVERYTSLSTAFTMFNFSSGGTGLAIGGVCTAEDRFQIYSEIETVGGVHASVIPDGTDLDEVRTSGVYTSRSGYVYPNNPNQTGGTFTLEVLHSGNVGQVFQRYTFTHKTNPHSFFRFYYNSTWGDWITADAYVTSWTNATLTNAFSNVSGYPLQYKAVGDIVYVRGKVVPNGTIAGSSSEYEIATLPEGYRPTSKSYFIQQSSNWYMWLLTVDTNGQVCFSRHRSGAAYIEANTTLQLAINASFPKT